jgi:catechol 2,3-dioxygenase-like lactoylglutathione lyase family enzyme
LTPRTALVVLAWLAAVLAMAPETAITGLDHIPIAVADLARAADDYRALGFALKPGRPHDDGIQNQHVKFRDGTELELITAPEARDALTTTYREHLKNGDGPAFLALFAPRMADADARLTAAKIAHARGSVGGIDFPPAGGLGYLFLFGRNQSPTDLPEHFAHVNTAEALIGVWLAAGDLSRERRLLQELGAAIGQADVRVPDAIHATVARLREGEVVLLPAARQLVPGRRIVGATLRVASLDTARAVLGRGQPSPPEIVTSADGRSVFLAPSRTHGLWLEFREQIRRPKLGQN